MSEQASPRSRGSNEIEIASDMVQSSGRCSPIWLLASTYGAETSDWLPAESFGREVTLLQGDAVPTFQNQKVKFRLVRSAKHPKRG
jgi:hypothetical protein